jgi:hypothetical protein
MLSVYPYISALESMNQSWHVRSHLNGILHKSVLSLCVYVYLYISMWMLGNGSVKMLPRQQMHNNRRIVRVVFRAVRLSKESGRFVFPPELIVNS